MPRVIPGLQTDAVTGNRTGEVEGLAAGFDVDPRRLIAIACDHRAVHIQTFGRRVHQTEWAAGAKVTK